MLVSKFKCNLLFGFEGAIYYSHLKLKIVQSDLPQHTPLLNEAWFSGEKVAIGPASLWSIRESSFNMARGGGGVKILRGGSENF